MMNAQKRYAVAVKDATARNHDGSPIWLHRCGHEHRSIEAADSCMSKLAGSLRAGTRSAKWARAEVVEIDPGTGELSCLSEDDSTELFEIQASSECSWSRPRPLGGWS